MSESAVIQASEVVATKKELRGVGGWLALLALGTVLSPVKMLMSFTKDIEDLLPVIDRAVPSVKVLLSAMIASDGFNIVYAVGLAAALIGHKRYFPKLFYGLAVLAVAQTLIFAVWFNAVIPNGMSAFLDEALPQTGGYLFAWSIWAAYVYRSKRVANTFVV